MNIYDFLKKENMNIYDSESYHPTNNRFQTDGNLLDSVCCDGSSHDAAKSVQKSK